MASLVVLYPIDITAKQSRIDDVEGELAALKEEIQKNDEQRVKLTYTLSDRRIVDALFYRKLWKRRSNGRKIRLNR